MFETFTDFDKFTNSWYPFIITFIITTVSALRIYVGGTYCHSHSRIDGLNVVITGATGGIGYHITKELAERGGNIIMAVRSGDKAKDVITNIRKEIASKFRKENPKVNIIFRMLDISVYESIYTFVEQIKREYEKIDILINNAGTLFEPFKRTVDGNELTLATNYLGPFLLTHLLLPLLFKSEYGRIINVSSGAHFNVNLRVEDMNEEKEYSVKLSFATTKLALTIFTKYMSTLCKDSRLSFYSVNPGLVRSNGHIAKSEFKSNWLSFVTVMPWAYLLMKSTKQGSQSIIYAAVEPALDKISGCYISDCEIKDPSDVVNDMQLAQLLYEKSCELVGIDADLVRKMVKEHATSTTSTDNGTPTEVDDAEIEQ